METPGKSTKKRKPLELPEVFVWPYNSYSKGAKALAEALKIKRFKREGQYASKYFEKSGQGVKMIINWGCHNAPATMDTPPQNTRIINKPKAVSIASDKVKTFEILQEAGVNIPEYTKDVKQATKWLDEGEEVLGRQFRGSSGTDISFFDEDPEAFLTSKFWSKYKKKKSEFRLHVVGDEIVTIQKKVLRKTDEEGQPIDTSNVDFRIRNLVNGFVFQRNDIHPPQAVFPQAVSAVKALGLDFGAVDVIYNETEDKAYVLEVNTAPGLEGTTIEEYASAFRRSFLSEL